MAAYEFEWDDAKAARKSAQARRQIKDVMAIFGDPLLLTIADPDHSSGEERWISIGENDRGRLVLAVHTFVEMV